MKRWPIIRHIRWAWHVWRFNRWARLWMSLGYVPNESDLDHLDRIWRGEA